MVETAQAQAAAPGRLLAATWPWTWAKLLHLIFLPLLAATRPWQLRYTGGDGLLGVCQIAYRFDTVERCLGELKRLQVGSAVRQALCRSWVQTLAPPAAPLHIYVDAHLKPHWTHLFMPCGHLPLLGRVMPCTRQVIVTNAEGYIWQITNRVGDAALSQEFPVVEQELERLTDHPVTLTVVDREANGLKLAQKYAASDHFALLTLLDEPVAAGLRVGTPALAEVFRLTGRWQPLPLKPAAAPLQIAPAVWAPARQADADPRVFWLVQEMSKQTICAVYALSQPLADCTDDVAAQLRGSGARTAYRQRWTATENVIRALVSGGNLNVNYGYEQYAVPNRLRQRQAAAAQAQVTATDNQLATNARQMEELIAQTADRQMTVTAQLAVLTEVRAARETEQQVRQRAGQTTRRVAQQLAQAERQTQALTTRHARRAAQTEVRRLALAERRTQLQTKHAAHQARLAAIDVTQPMFERDLEKDQIMVNFQAALQNAHHWCCDQYFTGAWSRLELATAIARIYRQRGRVAYAAQRVDVTLASFAYRDDHQLAEAACTRFNARQVHDAAGRLIVMAIAPFEHCVRHL